MFNSATVGIDENLDKLDWHGKRNMIRCVVKRIEIGNEEINVVYKVNKLPEYKNNDSAQHCCNSKHGSVGVTIALRLILI